MKSSIAGYLIEAAGLDVRKTRKGSMARAGLALLALFAAGNMALAADYWWAGSNVDFANGTPIPMGTNTPAGVWNTTIKNWATDRLGTSYVAWPNTGADTAWLANLQVYSLSSIVPAITQTVDMTVGRIVMITTNCTGTCQNIGYALTATNARTITLVGNAPEIDLSCGTALTACDHTRRLQIGSNVKLASTNGFTRGGYYGGQLLISSDCSAVSGTVSSVDGGSPSSYNAISLESGAANLRSVSLFDMYVGALSVTCASGANDQLNDAAVIRLCGREPDGYGASAPAFAQSGFQYRGSGSASTETLGQIILDSFGVLIFQTGSPVHGVLSLSHATAGISRGADGHGCATVKAAGSGANLVLNTDLVVSNGVATGVVLPWLAATEGVPLRINAGTRKLELVPVVAAPADLTTWTTANYIITNASYSPSGSIPSGTVIDTLGVSGPSSATVLTIGSSPTDTLTINSGLVAFNPAGYHTHLIITNGSLTSGTSELDIIRGDSGNDAGVQIYSRIVGSQALVKGGGNALNLYSSNTYSGVTYANNGALNFGAAGALPGDLVVGGGGQASLQSSSCMSTNSNILVRNHGRLFHANSISDTMTGTLTLDGGGLELGGYGSWVMNKPGVGLLFSNGGSITQAYYNGNAQTFQLLTDVQYAQGCSNQAAIITVNRTNLIQFMELTAASSATRVFDVSNSVTLAQGVPEMVINMPLLAAAGSPVTFVKCGSGVLELRQASGLFSGSTVVSNGTLLLSDYGPATNVSCSLTSGNRQVSALPSTNSLHIGQLVATNAAIKVRSVVQTLDTGTQLSMSQTASATTNITLSLLACGPLGTSSVSVVGSGVLSGSGGVGGNVTIGSGGALAPSLLTNQTTTFNIGGGLTVNSGGSLIVNLVGSTCDVVAVSGSVNINGGSLVVNGPMPSAGSVFPVLTSTNIAGTFTSVQAGYKAQVVGTQLQLSRAAAGFVFGVQ